MPSINDAGAYVPWHVRENTEWKRTMTIRRGGTPVDITGDTIEATVHADADTISALKTFTTTLVTPASGIFRLEITAANANLTPGTYYWYLKWTDVSLSDVFPLMHGPFIVGDFP